MANPPGPPGIRAQATPNAPASTFTILRPPCVALNNALVAFKGTPATAKNVSNCLEDLFDTLSRLTKAGSPLDERLADYVFFPVSQVFKERARLPVKASETALRCLDTLLKTGWRSIQDSQVAVQLLILLTFCADSAGPRNGPEKPQTSDDLRDAALAAMLSLFSSVSSRKCIDTLLDTPNIPAVGHCITAMLDCIKEDKSPSLQRSAARSLNAFINNIATPPVIRSFLPGIVSTLSLILTPTSGARRPHQLLQTCLQILQRVIRIALADDGPSLLRPNEPKADSNDAWIKSTAAQVKIALAHVVRLRDHDRDEVKAELRSLCWVVLDECAASMAESSQIMFETLIMLSGTDEDDEGFQALEAHFYDNPAIVETAQSYLYDLVLSLPRVMQSNDDSRRKSLAHRIVLTHRLLCSVGKDMSMIDDLLTSGLVEGLSNTISISEKVGRIEDTQEITLSKDQGHLTIKQDEGSSSLTAILARSNKHEDLVGEIAQIAQNVSGTKGALPMARKLLDTARQSQQNEQTLNLWLCISILGPLASNDEALDDFLDVDTSPEEDGLFQELYDFSLSILVNSEESAGGDWRLQEIALEGVALQAARMKQSFRPELVDALYPVVDLMGSTSIPLRNRALTCLNSIASSCGYDSAQDLLIKNVDYIVNAVGLKLNTFDISPQAPQVLLMMTKLCGPVLLPYLDDLVGSIFDALDCFHGYPRLVGLLFSVLNGIVEEGSKGPQGRITSGSEASHRKQKREPESPEDVLSSIKRRRKQAQAHEDDEAKFAAELPEETPHRPWSELRTSKDSEMSSANQENETPSNPPDPPSTTKDKTLAKLPSKTHLMIHSIASLTQHHLPSSSPAIRASVLALLTRALPYLSTHDDTFLPLINTLWPVLLPRLADPEAYVISGVLDVMACMCEGAGDFMATRIVDVWPTLKKLWTGVSPLRPSTGQKRGVEPLSRRNVTSSLKTTSTVLLDPTPSTSLILSPPPSSSTLANHPNSDVSAPYTRTTTLTVRSALTRLLVATLSHVRVSESMFFDALEEMLHAQLFEGGEVGARVREALEVVNADAVWLVLEKAKGRERMDVWEGVREGVVVGG